MDTVVLGAPFWIAESTQDLAHSPAPHPPPPQPTWLLTALDLAKGCSGPGPSMLHLRQSEGASRSTFVWSKHKTLQARTS